MNAGVERLNRIAVDVQVTAVGATPTMTFTVEGLLADGATWVALDLLQGDATQAGATAATTVTATGHTVRYVAGLDFRFYRGIRVNVSANTNVTFEARAFGLPD